MPKKETLGFRPTEHEEKLVAAAREATGFTPSELLRRCLRTGIAAVVKEVLQARAQSVRQFEDILATPDGVLEDRPIGTGKDEHATTPPIASSKTSYRSRKQRRKVA